MTHLLHTKWAKCAHNTALKRLQNASCMIMWPRCQKLCPTNRIKTDFENICIRMSTKWKTLNFSNIYWGFFFCSSEGITAISTGIYKELPDIKCIHNQCSHFTISHSALHNTGIAKRPKMLHSQILYFSLFALIITIIIIIQ